MLWLISMHSNFSFSVQLDRDLTLPSQVQECLHRRGLVALPPPGSCQHWATAPSCRPQLVVLVSMMIIQMARFLSLQISKYTPFLNSRVPPRASDRRQCLGRADSERFTRDGLMRRPWTRPRVALAWWLLSRSSILRACREWSNGRYRNCQIAGFVTLLIACFGFFLFAILRLFLGSNNHSCLQYSSVIIYKIVKRKKNQLISSFHLNVCGKLKLAGIFNLFLYFIDFLFMHR